jgi:hypothetical protein
MQRPVHSVKAANREANENFKAHDCYGYPRPSLTLLPEYLGRSWNSENLSSQGWRFIVTWRKVVSREVPAKSHFR